jgi:NAD(P)-dependent dehydrogenase (short-subunit alcohol dehydrogenase family)
VITPESFSLSGRHALVTGAARGLGAAMARSFAAFGADVSICDREADLLAGVADELRALGATVHTAVLDVRHTDVVYEWVAKLPPVSILVNNAGGTFRSPFELVNSKGQGSLVDENFTSVTNFVRACLPTMPDGSSIINITSVEAFRAAPGFGVYGAMKAAVEHLSRTLSLELADRRIRVNTIAPDSIPTPGDAGLAVGGEYGWKVPLGLGTADDVAGAAVFLASEASRLITGTTIHVDGGTDAARGWRRGPDGWEP